MPPNNQPSSGPWPYLSFAVAAVRVIAPLALWYAFLFLPIDSDGNAGWVILVTLIHPFLWFFGLAMLIAEGLFWVSFFCLALRQWGGALVAAGIATGMLVAITMFPNIHLEPRFAGVACLWASHVLVIVWATIGVACRVLGLDAEGQQIP